MASLFPFGTMHQVPLLCFLQLCSLVLPKAFSLMKAGPTAESPWWFSRLLYPLSLCKMIRWQRVSGEEPRPSELPGYSKPPKAGSSDSKESTCNAGDPSLISGLGRYPGEGSDNPLQYSCLQNFMDRLSGFKELDTTEQLTLSLHLKASKSLPCTEQGIHSIRTEHLFCVGCQPGCLV